MYHSPYYCPNNYKKNSYIRILHASPDAPPVDIYVNNNLIAKNLKYSQFTQYVSIMPGEYTIKVFPTNTKSNPVINTSLNIPANKIYTAAAIGKLANISLYPIEDPRLRPSRTRARVRFIHLSPNAPNVDITLPNGYPLFEDVGYKEITDYIPLKPATYTIEVRPSGSDDVVLYVPNIKLSSNKFYTIYAIGLVGDTPPLQVLIPLDGNSYL